MFVDRLLTRIEATLARPILTDVYGLARTLLAAATAGTLIFSPPTTLFIPVVGQSNYPICDGLNQGALFCLLSAHLNLARWIAVSALLIIASGWRPRYTAVIHWWITTSVACTISIPDGGDQLNQILTLLLIPVCLVDSRRWQWSPPRVQPAGALVAGVPLIAMWVIRVQMAGLYLQASIAKLGVPEWRDGSALYYWLNDPTFGALPNLKSILEPALLAGPVVLALTWGSMAIEFSLAISIFLPRLRARWLLIPGILLHTCIGVLMGLPSFSITMFAGLLLYLWPWEMELRTHSQFLRSRTSRLRQMVPSTRNTLEKLS